MSLPLKYLDRGASFSDCGQYRYRLWREWGMNFGEGSGTLAFAGLNPSTADGEIDDPIVRKLVGFAKRLGCVRLEIVNAFARVETNPRNLWVLDSHVLFGPGDRNENAVLAVVDSSPRYMVLGWGICRLAPLFLNADEHILGSLLENGTGDAFKLNADGSPAHPLYLPYDLVPRSIEELRSEQK